MAAIHLFPFELGILVEVDEYSSELEVNLALGGQSHVGLTFGDIAAHTHPSLNAFNFLPSGGTSDTSIFIRSVRYFEQVIDAGRYSPHIEIPGFRTAAGTYTFVVNSALGATAVEHRLLNDVVHIHIYYFRNDVPLLDDTANQDVEKTIRKEYRNWPKHMKDNRGSFVIESIERVDAREFRERFGHSVALRPQDPSLVSPMFLRDEYLHIDRVDVESIPSSYIAQQLEISEPVQFLP